MNHPPIQTISDAGHEAPRTGDMAILKAALNLWALNPRNREETQLRQQGYARQALRRARR